MTREDQKLSAMVVAEHWTIDGKSVSLRKKGKKALLD